MALPRQWMMKAVNDSRSPVFASRGADSAARLGHVDLEQGVNGVLISADPPGVEREPAHPGDGLEPVLSIGHRYRAPGRR